MSTYSSLGIELIGTGELDGTWGTATNTNLGTIIEQAIAGYGTQAITDGADTVITIPNGATGVARNMFIECTGTLTAARNLIVPASKPKLYFIFNNTTGGFAVTVKVSGQTGVSVPNGAKLLLVSNGTDVVNAINTINLTSALTVPSGGTGAATFTSGGLLRGNGANALSVASAADIVAAIGATAVANATNATTATTVTNGVYTTGNQTIAGVKSFTDAMSITSNASPDALTLSSSNAAGSNLKLTGTSGSPAAPNKYIRSLAGVLEVVNSAYTTALMQVYDTGDLAFNSGYGSSRVAYGCRAWVNFNGTGTVAIRGSGGVSSITDNGVGIYTVNFSTAMIDANYAISGMVNLLPSGYACFTGNVLAGSVTIYVISPGLTAASDPTYVSVAIHR
jgi:hypothetical protein